MSNTSVHLADDCALLPARDGMVVYKGESGRTFRVQPHIGQWLSHGAAGAACDISEEEKRLLIEFEIIIPGTAKWGGINNLAPYGMAGWASLSLVAITGILAWYVSVPELPNLIGLVVLSLDSWTTWVFVPVAALGLTLGHEWGHVLALRAMGGRAGRLHLRFGWPWAQTTVGPFRTVLGPWHQLLLVSGGMIVEAAVLGTALLCIKVFGPHAALLAVAVTEVACLTFNLFPTPWSDGGQVLSIALRQVISLVDGRADHD